MSTEFYGSEIFDRGRWSSPLILFVYVFQETYLVYVGKLWGEHKLHDKHRRSSWFQSSFNDFTVARVFFNKYVVSSGFYASNSSCATSRKAIEYSISRLCAFLYQVGKHINRLLGRVKLVIRLREVHNVRISASIELLLTSAIAEYAKLILWSVVSF